MRKLNKGSPPWRKYTYSIQLYTCFYKTQFYRHAKSFIRYQVLYYRNMSDILAKWIHVGYVNRQVKTLLGEVEEVLTMPEYLSRRVTITWKKAKQVT